MKSKSLWLTIYVLGILGFGSVSAQEGWASQPNIVLSQAIHFTAPNGQSVAVSPGKYIVEQAGATHMRLKREGGAEVINVQAQSLRHEQYELFSAMAMTRPGRGDLLFVDLLLPGGVKLEAVGSTSAPVNVTTPSIPTTPPVSISPSVAGVPPISQPPTIGITPSLPPSNPIPPTQPISPPQPFGAPSQISEGPDPTPMTRAYEREVETPEPIAPTLAYLPPTAPVPGIRVDGVYGGESPELPNLFVLAPDHIGLTIHEQPTLYWYLTQSTTEPIDVVMTEEETLRVVLDARLHPPLPAGIHAMSLKDYDVRLLKNVPYQWEAKIRAKTLTEEVKASGFIMRVEPPRTLSASVASKLRSPEAPKLFAQSGLWYDALGVLSDLIQSHPQSQAFLQQRAALLNQVGLAEVTKSSAQ